MRFATCWDVNKPPSQVPSSSIVGCPLASVDISTQITAANKTEKYSLDISVKQEVYRLVQLNCLLFNTVSVSRTDSSVWTVMNATYIAPLWRFSVILAPDINVMIYLITY